jgi:hypothetical protein
MDFIVGLPRTAKGFDSIWVIIDRVTKTAHFLPVKTYYSIITYAQIYVAHILSLHGISKTIVSDWDRNLYPSFGRSCTNPYVLNYFTVRLIILRQVGKLRG